MLLNFRQGLVSYQNSGAPNNTPTFLQKSGSYINLQASQVPTIFTIAHYEQDYIFIENANVTNAWGPFSNANYWLYWDVDFVTGKLTRNYTLYSPAIGPVAPTNPSTDQHWFNTSGLKSGYGSTFVWNVWNGSSWAPKLRCFAAQYQNGTTILYYPQGSQISVSGFDVYAGQPIFDSAGLPVQRFNNYRTGVFIHTAMPLSAQWAASSNFSVENALLQATASQSIPAFAAVAYTNRLTISLASSSSPQYPAVGVVVAPAGLTIGAVGSFIVSGFVQNTAWNWDVTNTQPPGTPLFVGTSGQITATPPTAGSMQVIGTVVDYSVIFVNPQPIIIFGS